MASPIRSLLTARVDRSLTVVESPLPSARTHPEISTWPAGGSGTSSGRVVPAARVASQPRSTSRVVPVSVTSGTTTSTPEAPSRVR